MTEEQLYNMKLHDTVSLTTRLSVTRVPGGLIYTRYMPAEGDNYRLSTCFVPLTKPEK